MQLSDFETPLVLAFVMLGTFLVARIMEKFINRPGAKDGYTIKDKKGNKLHFEVLRSATDEERCRIFEEKRREFDSLQAKRASEASRGRKTQ